MSLLFVVAVLLVTALSTAYGVTKASDSLRNAIVERQQKSAAGAATGLTYFLDASRQSLSAAAAVLSAADLTAPGGGQAGPLLDPLIANGRDFRFVALLAANGDVHVVRPMGAAINVRGYGTDAAFIEARNTGTARLSIETDAFHWFVPVPPTPDDQGYFLMGELNPVFVEDILFSNLDPSSTGFVLSLDDGVIASTDPRFSPASLQGWSALDALRDSGRAAVEGRTPIEGEAVILTRTSTLPRFGAQIAVLSPRTQLETLQEDLLRGAVMTAASLATVAAFVGILATNAILRPVGEVRSATNRMRAGDLAVRARPHGARELRELALDFNAMASSLSAEWEERVRLQNNLEKLVAERTQQLNQRQEDMELFFYGVSHDFKSPVISISNITQMLEEAIENRRIDRKTLKGLSQRIRTSSRNLQTLIEELLAFAQAERVSPKYGPTELRALVQSVLDEAQPEADRHGIELRLNGPSLTFETDGERVRHILSNLVTNAVKYMPSQADSVVTVDWARRGKDVEIRVQDNGNGIPQALRAQLFRPFSRYAPAGSKVAGAGLGLSIVKRLTESLNGQIELDPASRRGAVFRIRLPSRRSQKPDRGGP